jgi:hypothetical protein
LPGIVFVRTALFIPTGEEPVEFAGAFEPLVDRALAPIVRNGRYIALGATVLGGPLLIVEGDDASTDCMRIGPIQPLSDL